MGPLDSGLVEEKKEIEMRDGYKHPLRIVRPSKPPASGSPLIVCYHGGGFHHGSPNEVEAYVRGLAKLFGAVVVAPTYRLAPEHPFPQGISDTWDAIKWIAANASGLSATPSQGFIVSGESAGGNITAVLGQLAKSENLEPPVTGLWPSIPVLFNEKIKDPDATEWASIPQKYKEMSSSWADNRDSIILNLDLGKMYIDWYKPDLSSPLWSPFNASGAFKGLPRTFVQVGGGDLIRDDGIIYARALADHGVETRLVAYPGVPHAFWMGVPPLKQSRQYMTDVGIGVGWLLGKEVTVEEAEKALQYPGLLSSS